jgi:predicted amidohydrolase YtcJ
MTTPPQEIYAQTLAASRAGFQTCVHAIGDRANRVTLDTFERVQREVPGSRDLRMRVEHAQILAPAEISRFARLNVIASMQSTHATSDMPWVATCLGPERTAEGAYVWQKLMKTGVVLANGSDFPVEEPNPMLGFYAAITRQDPTGQPEGGWMPDEKMSRLEALKSFTSNAAYAAHSKRTLARSRSASWLTWCSSIATSTVEPEDILTTSVIVTIVGGELSH